MTKNRQIIVEDIELGKQCSQVVSGQDNLGDSWMVNAVDFLADLIR